MSRAPLSSGSKLRVPKRLVPGAGTNNPDARYLRNYHASFFALLDEADEDDEEEEEAEDEEDETAKPKKSLVLDTGSGIIMARAAIYDRGTARFEPNLAVAVLTRCRVETPLPDFTQLKVSRARFKKIVRAVDSHRAGKPLRTGAPVQVVGQPKGKHRLLFDVPGAVQTYPLFEVTPERIPEIARKVRETWSASPK